MALGLHGQQDTQTATRKGPRLCFWGFGFALGAERVLLAVQALFHLGLSLTLRKQRQQLLEFLSLIQQEHHTPCAGADLFFYTLPKYPYPLCWMITEHILNSRSVSMVLNFNINST